MAEPLYRRIADELRHKILSGELKAGMQLPTDNQLMEEYHVSKGTVRAAYKELERRELVYSRHREGTFVSEPVRPIMITLTSDLETGRGGGEGRVYTAEVAASGRDSRMGRLQVLIARAGPEIAELLEVDESTDVIVRHEEGFVDGLPWLLRTSYYPRDLENRAPRLLRTSNIEEGAVAYLAELGIEQGGYRDEIECRTPDETETSYFGLPADGHIQVFEIRRIAFDQNGNRIRLTVTIWRADRSKFVINVGEVPMSVTGQA